MDDRFYILNYVGSFGFKEINFFFIENRKV